MSRLRPLTDGTNMEAAIKRDRIDTLRRLARRAEKIERSRRTLLGKVDAFFTCTLVYQTLGATFVQEYRYRFVRGTADEMDLWRDPLCMSRRILSLCFMAAMVETGDA